MKNNHSVLTTKNGTKLVYPNLQKPMSRTDFRSTEHYLVHNGIHYFLAAVVPQYYVNIIDV